MRQYFEAQFEVCEVLSLDLDHTVKTIKTNKGDKKAVGVILATGAHPRQLDFSGEKECRGIAYCATCDGEFLQTVHSFLLVVDLLLAKKLFFLCNILPR